MQRETAAIGKDWEGIKAGDMDIMMKMIMVKVAHIQEEDLAA